MVIQFVMERLYLVKRQDKKDKIITDFYYRADNASKVKRKKEAVDYRSRQRKKSTEGKRLSVVTCRPTGDVFVHRR